MKQIKKLSIILGISFVLSVLAFLIDIKERTLNIFVNFFDIIVMTVLAFVAITIVFYLAIFLISLIGKSNNAG